MLSSLLLTVYSVASWNSSSPAGEDGGGRAEQRPCLDMYVAWCGIFGICRPGAGVSGCGHSTRGLAVMIRGCIEVSKVCSILWSL